MNVKDNASGAAWVKDTWSRLSASVEGPKLVPVKTTVSCPSKQEERHVKTLVPNCSMQVIDRALTPPRVLSVVTEGVTFRTAGGMYDDT